MQALILLATTPELFRLNRDVAAQLDVPGPYLAKVLKRFARLGYVESAKGRGGGYRISAIALEAPVLAVLAAADGNDPFAGCVIGLSRCTARTACPLHEKWAPQRDRMVRMFEDETIEGLAAKARKGRTRLVRTPRAARPRSAER